MFGSFVQRVVRRSRGPALLATALLALFGQLSAAGHLLLVPHRECAVHGLEHEGEASVATPAAVQWGEAFARAVQAPVESDHEGDACLFAQLRREQLCSSSSGRAQLDPEGALVSSDRAERPRLRDGAPLLLLAPKASPPV